jgi:hypothetical protein
VKVRLYLDEDVIPDLAPLLRQQGWNVVSCHEEGALEVPDVEQLTRATNDNRAILSFNYVDFPALAESWSRAPRPHAGIIISYRQYRRGQLGELRRAVLAMLNTLTAEELRDTIRTLDDFR